MPATTTSRDSARSSLLATSTDKPNSNSGPIATDDSTTAISVRRSRSASRSSLMNTIQASFTGALPSPPANAKRDERLLEIVVAAAPAQLVDAALGHRAPVRHDHHVVAQALHLLHDVRAKDNALAVLVAQLAQRLAQAANGLHVEAVGRLVEDDVRRVVNQRARERRLHALALAEALRCAGRAGR